MTNQKLFPSWVLSRGRKVAACDPELDPSKSAEFTLLESSGGVSNHNSKICGAEKVSKIVHFSDNHEMILVSPRESFLHIADELYWSREEIEITRKEAFNELTSVSWRKCVSIKRAADLLYQPNPDIRGQPGPNYFVRMFRKFLYINVLGSDGALKLMATNSSYRIASVSPDIKSCGVNRQKPHFARTSSI